MEEELKKRVNVYQDIEESPICCSYEEYEFYFSFLKNTLKN